MKISKDVTSSHCHCEDAGCRHEPGNCLRPAVARVTEAGENQNLCDSCIVAAVFFELGLEQPVSAP